MRAVEQALAAARALEQPAFISIGLGEQTIGEPASGSLAGLPFAVKDNIDVAGFVTTAANPATTQVSSATAAAVARLMAAGAVVIGKTNLDQYATGLVGTRSPYGACHSMFSRDHVSGGSSSGSAVAVAAGVVPFALGTDTAGSGRVPAAFNGLVGVKPTKGLVSTAGVIPACRSLDCVTVLSNTVAMGRTVLHTMAGFDPSDRFSRQAPEFGVRLRAGRPVFGVPTQDLQLHPLHQQAWEQALVHAATVADLVPVDVSPFLEAAQLLYSGPWIAERVVAFGHLLADSSNIDPIVRQVVAGAPKLSAEDCFRGMYRLAELRMQTEPAWQQMDALLLPTTPTHPTLAEVSADPISANSALGRFTNMTNLLDLAAVAVPAGFRSDGLPFGVQLLGPAFSDDLLLDLASAWVGEPGRAANEPGTVLLAVAGAHLSGHPLNWQLIERGARLVTTTTMASGYRMYEVAGSLPRPGVTRLAGDQRQTAIEVEVWAMPIQYLGSFVAGIAAPLGIGPVQLADGSTVLGFLCTADGVAADRDITDFGGWRAYLASRG